MFGAVESLIRNRHKYVVIHKIPIFCADNEFPDFGRGAVGLYKEGQRSHLFRMIFEHPDRPVSATVIFLINPRGDYVKIFNINYQHTDYRGGICRG